MTNTKRVLANLALGTVATLFALAAGEAIVRLFDIGPTLSPVFEETYQLSDNPVLRYELRPGSSLAPITINASGFRDRDYPERKPPNTFRIVCVGNSIVFGHRIDQGESFPDRLEYLLNAHYRDSGRRFEVLNCGVAGYNVTQSVEMIRARALRYEPDLIVYAYCLNDPQDYSFELEQLHTQLTQAQLGFRSRLLRRGERLALKSRLYAWVRYLIELRTSGGQKQYRARAQPEWTNWVMGTWVTYFQQLHTPEGGWHRVEAGLTTLAQLPGERPAYVVLFPIFRELAAYPFAAEHTRLRALADSLGLRAVDLQPLYAAVEQRTKPPFYADYLHPNALGHEIAAMALLRQLLADGTLPLTDRDIDRIRDSDSPDAPLAALILRLSTP